ncbi:MAG: hypothetical protein FJ137_04725 [Deltaproteobacteria bacterium]|nr:hypothetical protein [Deltaproteobacteria bacterium]
MKHVIVSLALLATPLPSMSARAGTPAEAAQSVAAADELFVKGEYDAALTAYRAAYKLQAEPELFLKMGRCFQQRGQNDLAISSYERYLTDAPNGARRAAAEQLISDLKGAAPDEFALELGGGEESPPAGELFPEEAAPAGEPFPEESTPPADEAKPAPPSPAPPATTAMPPPELHDDPAPPPVTVDPTVLMTVGAVALVVVTGGALAAALALQPPAPPPQGDLGTFDLR